MFLFLCEWFFTELLKLGIALDLCSGMVYYNPVGTRDKRVLKILT